MPYAPSPHTRPHVLLVSLLATLAACSTLTPRDPLQIQLVGIEPLPSEDLEMRFRESSCAYKTPTTAPSTSTASPWSWRSTSSRCSAASAIHSGQVPRYGETILQVPVSLSAYAMLRQAWGAAGYQNGKGLPYELRGKLAAGLFGTRRFNDRGTLNWPQPLRATVPPSKTPADKTLYTMRPFFTDPPRTRREHSAALP